MRPGGLGSDGIHREENVLHMRWSSALVLVLVVLVMPVGATDVRPAAGHRAPDFALRDVNGTPVQLSRVVGQKAVLLNFWATWCPPCREEMPTIEQAYRDYRARGLEVLAVSIDAGGEKSVAPLVRRFMAELGLTFPALLDSKGEAVRAYQLRGLPTTFLIDRAGMVRSAEIGFRDWSDAASRRKLEALLE
jgi:peroxiredoxin